MLTDKELKEIEKESGKASDERFVEIYHEGELDIIKPTEAQKKKWAEEDAKIDYDIYDVDDKDYEDE